MRKITPQLNKVSARPGEPSALQKARKRLYWQAGLAVVTILLTVIMMFAMTAAWYTNIVQTSGLVFEAAAWGFDGTITVTDAPIQAAPGEEGIIHLEVENQSESLSDISVNVSKTQMNDEMKQRLYFYVENQQTRNGETMDRVYLNSLENYTYTVFNGGTLTLTENYHNDALLKWQWVYDVLGYYVLATETPLTTSDVLDENGQSVLDENGQKVTTVTSVKMQINEYLRPIEYDYDAATTTFVKEGEGETATVTAQLATVDGEMTVDEFLKTLSGSDGYPGVVDPNAKNPAGFYPVAVVEDENTGTRTGVWAYLCSYSEIQLNTQYDTALGNAAAEARAKGEMTPTVPEDTTTEGDQTAEGTEEGTETEETTLPYTYVAQLQVSAQKSNTQPLTVNTVAGLQSALSEGIGDIVQLGSNLTVTAPLTVPDGRKVLLDLNGKTITIAGDGNDATTDAAIDAQPGSAVTVVNGVIDGANKTGTYAVNAAAAEVTLSGVTIENVANGIRMEDVQPVIPEGATDENGNPILPETRDSKVRLVDCSVTAVNTCVTVIGNGIVSGQNTQLIVEDCELVSQNYIAISGNGTETGNGQWGTDIQILNSTVQGYWGGIYHPQKDSTLTVYNSTVIGYTGIAIKGGTVNLIASQIQGTGEKNPAAFANSGYTDTGDAVYIETNYEYQILLNISKNSTLSSTHSYSLQVFDPASISTSVQIVSGNFDQQQPEAYLVSGSVQEQLQQDTLTWWAVTSPAEQAEAAAQAAAAQTESVAETDAQPAA